MRLTDLVFLVELKIQHGTIVCYLLVLFRFTAIASCLDGFSNLCFELMGLKGRLRHILHGDRDGSRSQAPISAKRYSFSTASVGLSDLLLLLAVWIVTTICTLAGWGLRGRLRHIYTATETDRAPRSLIPAKCYSFLSASVGLSASLLLLAAWIFSTTCALAGWGRKAAFGTF